ncbi:hypothetical protein [Thauera sp. 2A1]|uniref:hypothetical protein n=1 Tax=Thauera sp. 2A1 TaxID=2570191 RepID=UPI0012917736|nr:hypothetical protein [Thauera sp. 2A1]KAI5914597.1 hypothetical protein GH664_11670 [Thauera sp. 2A1]
MLTVFIQGLPPAWEGQLRLVCADGSVQVQGQRYRVDAAPGQLVTLVRATDEPAIDYLVAEALDEGSALEVVYGRPRVSSYKPSRPCHAGSVKLQLNKRRWWRGGSSRAPVA